MLSTCFYCREKVFHRVATFKDIVPSLQQKNSELQETIDDNLLPLREQGTHLCVSVRENLLFI